MNEYGTTIFSTPGECGSFLPVWLDFAGAKAESCSFYQDPRVVSATLQERESLIPCFAVVSSSCGVQGIAACVVEKRSFPLRLGLRSVAHSSACVLRMFGDDLIYARGANKPEVLRAALRALAGSAIGWDFLLLENLPIPGLLWDTFAAGGAGFDSLRLIEYPGRRQTVRRLDLSGSFDEYLRAMSSDTRYNLLRRKRKLEEHAGAGLELLCFTRPDQVADLLERVDAIHGQSWQAATFGRSNRATKAERGRLEHLSAEGWMRSYVLQSGGTSVAFVVGFQYKGTFHHEETAYDRAWAGWGPGSVLNLMLIEDLFRENPPSVLDFGFGDNEYKRIFSNRESAACVAFVTDTRRRRGRRIVAAQTALGQAERITRAALRGLRLDRMVSRWVKHKQSKKARE